MRLNSLFIKRFGRFGFIRLLFYPLTALVATPVRLMQTLWNSRVLAGGRWGDYSHFSTYAGICYLIYWTIASNLCRFEFSGYSPCMGLGRHPLRRFFQYSLISLYPYWKASTIVLLLGMFGWIFAHLIWLYNAPALWVLFVLFLATISTTFYVNTFALQNYNVLGWIFFPLGLYGIFAKSWVIAAVGWLFASFGSCTVAFIAGIISVVTAVMTLDLAPIFAFIPACLILLAHLRHLSVSGDMKASILILVKALGMTGRDVKYKDKYSQNEIVTAVYFLLIYGQFLIVYYSMIGNIPVIFLTGLAIFMIANLCPTMRSLDIQSGYMLMFSLATAEVLSVPDMRLLPSYWILISPLPLVIPFPFMKRVLDVVPALAPFSIKELKKGAEDFLHQVKPGERVFLALNDPNGMSKNLFDGYRAIYQLLIYVASEKGVHIMPDVWAVYELNYRDAPDIWGRDVDSVSRNISLWGADHVVVYQDAGTKLSPEWGLAGFKALSKFSWAEYETELRGVRPYGGETPDWWLLSRKI